RGEAEGEREGYVLRDWQICPIAATTRTHRGPGQVGPALDPYVSADQGFHTPFEAEIRGRVAWFLCFFGGRRYRLFILHKSDCRCHERDPVVFLVITLSPFSIYSPLFTPLPPPPQVCASTNRTNTPHVFFFCCLFFRCKFYGHKTTRAHASERSLSIE
ncbi:unnamed protein product, partial [Laminaria digitata]